MCGMVHRRDIGSKGQSGDSAQTLPLRYQFGKLHQKNSQNEVTEVPRWGQSQGNSQFSAFWKRLLRLGRILQRKQVAASVQALRAERQLPWEKLRETNVDRPFICGDPEVRCSAIEILDAKKLGIGTTFPKPEPQYQGHELCYPNSATVIRQVMTQGTT